MYRLGGQGVTLQLPDGTWATSAGMISSAITAWTSGSAAEQHAIETILDQLNNGDAVPYIPASACGYVFP